MISARRLSIAAVIVLLMAGPGQAVIVDMIVPGAPAEEEIVASALAGDENAFIAHAMALAGAAYGATDVAADDAHQYVFMQNPLLASGFEADAPLDVWTLNPSSSGSTDFTAEMSGGELQLRKGYAYQALGSSTAPVEAGDEGPIAQLSGAAFRGLDSVRLTLRSDGATGMGSALVMVDLLDGNNGNTYRIFLETPLAQGTVKVSLADAAGWATDADGDGYYQIENSDLANLPVPVQGLLLSGYTIADRREGLASETTLFVDDVSIDGACFQQLEADACIHFDEQEVRPAVTQPTPAPIVAEAMATLAGFDLFFHDGYSLLILPVEYDPAAAQSSFWVGVVEHEGSGATLLDLSPGDGPAAIWVYDETTSTENPGQEFAATARLPVGSAGTYGPFFANALEGVGLDASAHGFVVPVNGDVLTDDSFMAAVVGMPETNSYDYEAAAYDWLAPFYAGGFFNAEKLAMPTVAWNDQLDVVPSPVSPFLGVGALGLLPEPPGTTDFTDGWFHIVTPHNAVMQLDGTLVVSPDANGDLVFTQELFHVDSAAQVLRRLPLDSDAFPHQSLAIAHAVEGEEPNHVMVSTGKAEGGVRQESPDGFAIKHYIPVAYAREQGLTMTDTLGGIVVEPAAVWSQVWYKPRDGATLHSGASEGRTDHPAADLSTCRAATNADDGLQCPSSAGYMGLGKNAVIAATGEGTALPAETSQFLDAVEYALTPITGTVHNDVNTYNYVDTPDAFSPECGQDPECWFAYGSGSVPVAGDYGALTAGADDLVSFFATPYDIAGNPTGIEGASDVTQMAFVWSEEMLPGSETNAGTEGAGFASTAWTPLGAGTFNPSWSQDGAWVLHMSESELAAALGLGVDEFKQFYVYAFSDVEGKSGALGWQKSAFHLEGAHPLARAMNNVASPLNFTFTGGLIAEANGPYNAATYYDTAISGTASGGVAPYTCSWAGSDATFADAALCDTDVKYNAPGSYTITLTVTDAEGTVSDDVATVLVDTSPLSAEAGGDYAGEAYTPIDIVGAASGGTPPATCAWTGTDASFGDAAACDTTVTYTAAGQYTITLEVTDADGAKATDTAIVDVVARTDEDGFTAGLVFPQAITGDDATIVVPENGMITVMATPFVKELDYVAQADGKLLLKVATITAEGLSDETTFVGTQVGGLYTFEVPVAELPAGSEYGYDFFVDQWADVGGRSSHHFIPKEMLVRGGDYETADALDNDQSGARLMTPVFIGQAPQGDGFTARVAFPEMPTTTPVVGFDEGVLVQPDADGNFIVTVEPFVYGVDTYEPQLDGKVYLRIVSLDSTGEPVESARIGHDSVANGLYTFTVNKADLPEATPYGYDFLADQWADVGGRSSHHFVPKEALLVADGNQAAADILDDGVNGVKPFTPVFVGNADATDGFTAWIGFSNEVPSTPNPAHVVVAPDADGNFEVYAKAWTNDSGGYVVQDDGKVYLRVTSIDESGEPVETGKFSPDRYENDRYWFTINLQDLPLETPYGYDFLVDQWADVGGRSSHYFLPKDGQYAFVIPASDAIDDGVNGVKPFTPVFVGEAPVPIAPDGFTAGIFFVDSVNAVVLDDKVIVQPDAEGVIQVDAWPYVLEGSYQSQTDGKLYLRVVSLDANGDPVESGRFAPTTHVGGRYIFSIHESELPIETPYGYDFLVDQWADVGGRSSHHFIPKEAAYLVNLPQADRIDDGVNGVKPFTPVFVGDVPELAGDGFVAEITAPTSTEGAVTVLDVNKGGDILFDVTAWVKGADWDMIVSDEDSYELSFATVDGDDVHTVHTKQIRIDSVGIARVAIEVADLPASFLSEAGPDGNGFAVYLREIATGRTSDYNHVFNAARDADQLTLDDVDGMESAAELDVINPAFTPAFVDSQLAGVVPLSFTADAGPQIDTYETIFAPIRALSQGGDGGAVTCSWTSVPGVTFGDATACQTTATSDAIGDYRITVTMTNETGVESQDTTTLFVAAGPSAANSIVLATSPHIADGLDASNITLVVYDSTGARFTSGGQAVTIGSATLGLPGLAFSTVDDLGDGTYNITLASTVAQIVPLDVLLDGVPVYDASGAVETVEFLAGDANPRWTTISVSNATILDDGVNRTDIYVELRDATGNNVTGASLVISGDDGSTLATTEISDGNYTAPFTSMTHGDVLFSIVVDGAPMSFPTELVEVVPVLTVSNLVALPTVIVADGVDASELSFTASDRYGVPYTGVGTTWTTTLGSLSTGPDAAGEYKASLTSTVEGTATVTVDYTAGPGSSGTLTTDIQVNPAPIDPLTVTVGGPYVTFASTAVSISASPSGGEGAVTCSWSGASHLVFADAASCSTTVRTNVAASASSPHVITVTATDSAAVPKTATATTGLTVRESSVGSPPDADGDGIHNGADNCPNTPNPGQEDADGNGVGDACQLTIQDGDQDGVEDEFDHCPLTAAGASVDESGCSQAQRDDDGDGVANGIDQCANTPSGRSVSSVGCPVVTSTPADEDDDGIPDSADNCLGTKNSNQADLDGDGKGDLCDDDLDGDGVANIDDAFPEDPRESSDLDGDGVGDVGDNCPNEANAAQADVDGNGVGDACDLVELPDVAIDTDGDGFQDFVEVEAGTDPQDPKSFPGAVQSAPLALYLDPILWIGGALTMATLALFVLGVVRFRA